MTIRGSRRVQVLVAAVAAVLVAVVVVVVVGRDGEVFDAPVATSTLDGFPTRGALADDQDTIEAAADVWREGERYRAETRPSGPIQLLWAGELAPESLDGLVRGQDMPAKVQVVVLRSGDEIATFAQRQIDTSEAFDSLGILTLPSTVGAAPKIAPGGLVLVADRGVTEYSAVAEDGGPMTLEADDGMLELTDRDVIVRVGPFVGDRAEVGSLPGLVLSSGVVQLEPEDLDRVWAVLAADKSTHEAVRGALQLTAGAGDGDARLRSPVVSVVVETSSPDGRSLLVLTARGVNDLRSVVAVDYEPGAEANPVTVSLGLASDAPSWTAHGWVSAGDRAPYLVVVGGGSTVDLQVFLGREAVRLAAPGGVVLPSEGVDPSDLPGVVVAGFTADGSVVPDRPTV